MSPSRVHSNSIVPFLVLSLLLPNTTSRPLLDAPGDATWNPFAHLLNAERGAHVPAMPDLKRYLSRLGYLPSTPGNFTDLFDDGLATALSLYQSNLGLAVTGELDPPTVSQLSTPRCGFPDDAGPASAGPASRTQRFSFFNGRPSWDRARPFTLTYAFSPEHFVGYLDRSDVEAAFARAFDRWAAVIPVRFEATERYASADVRIGFHRGNHGDGQPFDGVLGILAHAFSPEDGRLHLDLSETWALDFATTTSPVAMDLESVATHEIGHVLGLRHTSMKDAVMYPSLRPRTTKLDLRVDDIEGVQALYGSNPNFKFSSLAQSDISAANPLFIGGCGRKWTAVAAAVTAALLCIIT